MQEHYSDSKDEVSWKGLSFQPAQSFDQFMSTQAIPRLTDADFASEFEEHLKGLTSTGFGEENLSVLLEAEIPETRSWAIGEAIAEAWLELNEQVIWPWHHDRDKRTPKASLPGKDLIGFARDEQGQAYFVFGEVKSSSQAQSPPNVLNGAKGMIKQIEEVVNDRSIVHQLVRWLFARCKGTEFEEDFNEATSRLFESGLTDFSLYGILIRDTAPNSADLSGRATAISTQISNPTDCQLVALYLPCAIGELPSYVTEPEDD
ncbi:MAG: hypothetical protein MI745_09460 [Pseudomonadales bacterium]|nr:hypothetical protein [Pseudomonadales bacterium]